MIGLQNALYPSVFGDLEVHIERGQFFVGGALLFIPPTVVFLEPNATSYISVSFSGKSITLGQTGYAPGNFPICRAVCDTERVQLFDDRPDFTDAIPDIVTPSFADAEIPSGAINGTNATFTLANSPTPAASLILMLNGVLQTEGIDYTLSGQTIEFAAPPVTGDELICAYRY